MDEKTRAEILSTLWGEAANQPIEGIIAVLSTMFNRFEQTGDWSKVLKGYSAYSTKSTQYRRSKMGGLNSFEKQIFGRNEAILDSMISGKTEIIPGITNFENLKAFPRPKWADKMNEVGTFGDQTFFAPKSRLTEALKGNNNGTRNINPR